MAEQIGNLRNRQKAFSILRHRVGFIRGELDTGSSIW